MHIFEAFHRLLKVVYLECKQSQWLDHLLSTILKVARDKEFEQLQKLHKGKVTHRSSEINRRHKKAEEMINNGIEPVVLSATTREVQSQSNSSIALWSSCKVITSVFANWYVHLAKCVYMVHMATERASCSTMQQPEEISMICTTQTDATAVHQQMQISHSDDVEFQRRVLIGKANKLLSVAN